MTEEKKDACFLCKARLLGCLVFLPTPKTDTEVELQLEFLTKLCPECLIKYFPPNPGKK